MKLLIIGHGRHGKDEAAEYLNRNYGMTFKSSSMAAAEIFMFDALKDEHGYKTIEECFEDRVNHRAEWYNLICDYNKEDRARLAKGILENSDCYVGMRDREEILECQRQELFDMIIWIDASDRVPLEDKSSFNIDWTLATHIIPNNGSLLDFHRHLDDFADKFLRNANFVGTQGKSDGTITS